MDMEVEERLREGCGRVFVSSALAVVKTELK